MTKQSSLSKVLLILGILILLNLISYQIFFRADFTADKRYTLSSATKATLNDLNDVVTVKAYFSEDLPPQLLSTRKDFMDQLIEYEKRSDGYLVYEFINPNESDDTESKAQQEGINPLIVNVTERDQVQQLRAYMGAVLQVQDRREVIPIIQPGGAMEYELTSAIKKLIVTEKPKIAMLQGQGQPGTASIPQLAGQLEVIYDLEPFNLNDTTEVPLLYQSALLINPTDTLSPGILQKLDNFLESGKGLFVAYNNFRGQINNGYIGPATDIGLVNWLSKKGALISQELITDINCASVGVPQQLGPFSVTAQIQFPYFPIISNFTEHPVNTGLEAILLPLANAVIPAPTDSSVQVQSLAFTSVQSGSTPLPLMVDVNKEWTTSDFPASSQSVALALSGFPGKLVVIGSANFAVNGNPGQQQQLNPDNVNFVANAMDWMSDDTGLNDLRTKGVTARPLQPLDEGTKNLLKYANVLLPILLILIYGLMRRQSNLRKRQRWLEGSYL